MKIFRKICVSTILCWLSSLMMTVTLYMVFFYASEDKAMGGVAQRIFYFHISSAWIAFLAFFLVMIASLLFLITRKARWDILAHASAETGTLFWTFVLLSGFLWARPAWKTWWPWGNLCLIASLSLWLFYGGYLLVRHYSEGKRGVIYTALLGMLAFIPVPLVSLSLRQGQMIHPVDLIISGNAVSGVAPEILATLKVCLVTFFCLFVYLLQQRVVLGIMQLEVDKIRRSIAEHHVQYGFLVENQNFVIEEYNIEEYSIEEYKKS